MNALIICGLSFSGKSTLAKILATDPAHGFEEVVSSTTRSMRNGERDGVDYHFLSVDDFKNGIANNDFVDHADVHGNLYGSRFGDYQSIYDAGKIPMLVCDPNGAKNLAAYREQDPSFRFTSVFINLNPHDASLRALERLDNDMSAVHGDEADEVLTKNAKRMTKIFHPDLATCQSICREHLMGRKESTSKLARLFIDQQTLACQGKKVECVEHEWMRAYPYDLIIQEGINKERQPGVIYRIKRALELVPPMEASPSRETVSDMAPTSSR